MNFQPNQLYHIYNRGNQQQQIFFNNGNYIFFLEKIRKYLLPYCDILCWCLMPNHFHLLINTNASSCELVPNRSIPIQQLAEQIRLMLSGYTKAVQKQQNMNGNLFQQKTKAKIILNEPYSVIAFHYIHQNPFTAGLVNRMEDWEYSSFKDYMGVRKGNLCNKELSRQMLDINEANFYKESYEVIDEGHIREIE